MKKIVIIVNTYKAEALAIAASVKHFLLQKNIDSDLLQFNGEECKHDFSLYEYAITCGGDGTVLFAARGCAPFGIPIFPINLGEFGFIAGISKQNWQEDLTKFLQTPKVTKRSMLSVNVERKGKKVFSCTALNDVVVASSNVSKIISLDIAYNGDSFGNFKADGIIVATPTGSTAYSAAAGGPIVDPDLDAFVLSPICAFSLSNRPLVLHPDGFLTIKVLPSRGAGATVAADGQCTFALECDDVVTIQKSNNAVLLASCDAARFYAALKSKLHWSGGPGA